MSDLTVPQDLPTYVRYDVGVLQWSTPYGKTLCPDCEVEVVWSHDGALWKGRCQWTCGTIHFSTQLREWPA
jgi:hypothetical protein